ncbi:peptide synthetase [Metarhizium acridum CQMa 102]|uniref:Peptide synthetase n=1 Tax=Metarhizium acridum (strain CQMa 102) TaxID=655827 RepID=E9DZ33_METAQ|nr:peptide synthetase [Metarhizium acridum CQMa 102]EFY90995.1 peptide synthetase [Metarhizium acridum CQMa 102]
MASVGETLLLKSTNLQETGSLHTAVSHTDGIYALQGQRRSVSVALSDNVESLQRFCHENGFQLHTIFKAAWGLVLGKYLGLDHVVFSSLVQDGRVDAAPASCQLLLDETVSVLNLLRNIELLQTKTFDAEKSPETRDSSSLSDSQLVFQVHQPGKVVAAVPRSSQNTGNIVLLVQASDNMLKMTLSFSTSTLAEEEAVNIGATFAKAISLIVLHPDQKLNDLELISDRDLASIWGWNKTQPRVIDRCVHHIIQSRVEQQPHALAICGWDACMTYRQLEDYSNRLAHHLSGLGIGPEVIVPLCFEKSAWAIVALLGVVKAGGAFAFIDPSHPKGRRDDIISQIASTLVLTSVAQAGQWTDSGLKVVPLGPQSVDALTLQTQPPVTAVRPNNILYIIFTSGSTGRPKACVVEHSSFCSGAVAQAEVANMDSSSRVLQLASFSFDVSLLEIMTALMHGACICMPSAASMNEGVAKLINTFQITWAFLTPSLVKVIDPRDVPDLKTLILGGEALSKSDIDTWAEHVQLGNGYGPSECSVAAAGNPNLTPSTSPSNIGRAVGGLCWIVNAEDHNKLVPVGCVGELLIEGPIVARGYLNAPEKTAEVFVTGPHWGPITEQGASRRLYKTGDLARYNTDGTIHFIGRKDTQVKLRGLRIELGEIEHHISMHGLTQHAIVVLPKTGPCKERLVVALSLKDFLPDTSKTSDVRLIPEEARERASEQVADIKEQLSRHVPHYMVPETWIIVEAIPLMLSGKMARSQVSKWIAEMDDETYDRVVGVQSQGQGATEMTENETQLQLVYSDVLNLTLSRIPLDRSFLSLGGDSISAMQVVSRCRSRGMAITVKDIIALKGISELALRVVNVTNSAHDHEESFDTPFDLSPVQRMYVATTPLASNGSSTRYNQSFFLNITRQTEVEELRKGFQMVVAKHSMLRARFVEGEHGTWQQVILKQVQGTYNFLVHDLIAVKDIDAIIEDAQSSVDLIRGPVFAAHVFNVESKGQFLFLVAHHAIIDLVSWRVVMKDLEDALTTRGIANHVSLPYQKWLQLQADNARDHGSPSKVLPFSVAPPDMQYWGMEYQKNFISDTSEDTVKLSLDLTKSLMGSQCHAALRTEPIDLILSILMYSFAHVFNDRATPAFFRESHGRESWTDEIDISETVGWFTTMFPLCTSAGFEDDIVEFTRQIKDNRHAIPANGRPYFASRFLNQEGMEAFADHSQVEICFDYLGLYQQLEKPDALLRQEPRTMTANTSDIGPNVRRFALIEITAEMISNQMQFSFVYNHNMKNMLKLKEWIASLPDSFAKCIDQLSKTRFQHTLSDFPMLKMSYKGLERLSNDLLPQIGISFEEVQDVYPCSPMQQGLLISQSKSTGVYKYRHTAEIVSRSADPVDLDRLASAWEKVVQRHSVLRTIFIPSVSTEGVYDQVVLKDYRGRVSRFQIDGADPGNMFENQAPIEFTDIEPPNRLSVCQTNEGRVFCQFEFNHAVIDGGSMPIILQDFILAYDGTTPDRPAPLFREYISYLGSLPKGSGLKYWMNYLKDIEPTCLPSIQGSAKDPQFLEMEVNINIEASVLLDFCQRNNLTLSNIFHVAWGLVLRAHTGRNDVCFGYLLSGREAPIRDIDRAVGPFITMLVSRLGLEDDVSILKILQKVQGDFLLGMEHQHYPLADIQHELGLAGQPLFNTVLSFQKSEEGAEENESTISVIGLEAYDPPEYEVTLDVMVSEADVVTTLGYWTSSISSEQAKNLGCMFSRAIDCIVRNINSTVDDIDLVGREHMTQILQWNADLPPAHYHCIHHLFHEQALKQPEAPAICSFDGNFTYAELDVLSTKLAHHLVSMGVGPQVYVPFCFHKSAWATISIMAILKAGGACIPMDPAQPSTRLEAISAMCSAKVAVTAPRNAHLLEGFVDTIISVDQGFINELPTVAGIPCASVRPDNVAYVIFSSGTTGNPKGIQLYHYSLATFALWNNLIVKGNGPGQRVLQFAAYTFDVSISDILGSLMFGACICNISDHDRMNNLSQAIHDVKATSVDLTATVAALIRPADVPSVRILQLGGEALTKEVVDIWAGNLDTLVNVYGPAECSITSSYSCNISDDTDLANIGRVVGGLGWVVEPNNHDKLAPLGCVGELLIEGAILSAGYLGDPEKTKQSFIWNPIWSRTQPGVDRRFYKTGDLVRYNSDGSLHILGRGDTQIKLYGQRLDLTDIEAQVIDHQPSLRQVTVEALVPKETTRKTLAAFFAVDGPDDGSTVGSSDSTPIPLTPQLQKDLQGLQNSLALSLPRYMIPSMYISMSQMPMTPSGKTNRAALRKIAAEFSERQWSDYSLEHKVKEPPSTDLAKRLQQLWSVVLCIDIKMIGAKDSFFGLGGDSVAAMRLVAAARASNIQISVMNIFKYPNLCDMALTVAIPETTTRDLVELDSFALLEPSCREEMIGHCAERCKVEKNFIEDVYPCTPLQEGLMAISTRLPRAYVARMVFKIPPTIDLNRFRNAWQQLISLEPILRTRVILTNTNSVQVVLREENPWKEGLTLETYLEKDRGLPIEYGGLLHRLCIIDGLGQDSYFVWTVHHALYDGWSQNLLFERAKQLYMGDAVSKSPPYNRFIHFLAQGDKESSNTFWKSQLLREQAPTSFPVLPAPSYKPRADQVQTLRLPLSRQKHSTITSATLIKAAWAMVVSQYSRSDDIILALTLSGRTAPVPGIMKMTGPTITTVPLRIKLPSGNTTVYKYLEIMQSQAMEMMPYEHVGIQSLRRLCLEAEPDYELDLKHLLVIQSLGEFDSFLDLELLPTEEDDFNTYALIAQCSLENENVCIEARYDKNVIETEQMKRMLWQFQHIIRQLNDESHSTTMEGIDLVSPQDRQQLEVWNSQKHDPMNMCIHEVIEKQMRSRPVDTPAICAWDGELSYQELDRLSNGLAAHLVDLGVGPEVMVPICFDKSLWTIVTMTAVLKAGGAYVSLSSAHPLSRLRGIIDDIDAGLILVAPQYAELFVNVVPRIIVVEPSWVTTLPTSGITAPSVARPESAAFVVFTSGSTGKPKGVVIEHRSMVTMAHAEGPSMQFDSDTRALNFAASTFDVSNSEVLTTLMFGGCVCVPSEAERLNDLTGVINKWKVNWLFLTPAMADILDPAQVPTLRSLALGGEAIRQDLVERWAAKVHLINSYGPSETTIWTSNSHLSPGKRPANIGRGYGAHTWVTDVTDHNRLAPIGCVGELLVEGPILARGYVKNPQTTSAAFIFDPPWATGGQRKPRRMYKTGDLVKYNVDGTLDYVGRKDTQVKLRGQRIEPCEIEDHIRQSLPDAQHVAVEIVSKEGHKEDRALAAFLQLVQKDQHLVHGTNNNLVPMTEEFRRSMLHLQQLLVGSLPPYMVPQLFIVLRQAPTTSSGKLDRKAMREMAAKLPKAQLAPYMLGDVEKVAPSTPMEIKLQSFWASLLRINVSTIGANDNFFQSGGDSIIAMRLVAEARANHLSISVADIFRFPKLSEMAKAIQEVVFTPATDIEPFSLLRGQHSSEDIIQIAASLCGVETEAIEDVYPCTSLQKGLFSITIRDPGAYIAQKVFQLRETLDLDRFKSAWQTLADMHPILRTRILDTDLQVVVRESLAWQSASTLRAYLQDDLAKNMNFGKPLSRYAIVEGHFIWTAHHAVYDAWSNQLLFDQLRSIYHDDGIPKPVPYSKFIEHLENIDQSASMAFWKRQLSGDKPTSFPEARSLTHKPRPNQAFTYSIAITRSYKSETLMSSILQAAWALAVARHSNSNDVAFAMALSGRNLNMQSIESVIGPTITTVPIVMNLDMEQTVVGYLRNTQNKMTEMIPFAHVGLQNLRSLENYVDLKHLFVIQSAASEDTEGVLGMIPVSYDVAGFDSYGLVVECVQDADKVDVEVRFDTAIISHDRIQKMLNLFQHLVGQLNKEDSRCLPLRDVSFFSPQDAEQVAAWNKEPPLEKNETMHHLVQAQVSARPLAPAILASDGSFTYAELDSRSTQLAHHLVQVGVKPEVMVLVCYNKSAWTIIAMLAIIKAGGACVAINPEHPPERLQAIAQDVKASIVVTQQQHGHIFQEWNVNVVLPTDSLTNQYPTTGTFTSARPENPAFVVFTSGSTGTPKGICLEHRALCASAQAHGKAMRLGTDSRVLQFAAYTFDVSIGEIFTTLIYGGCVCVPTEEERLNDLAAFINRMKINWAYLTPTVASFLQPADVPTLKTLSLGGEAVTKENVAVWASRVHLINIYGPAETSIWSTALCGLKSDTSPTNIGYGVGALMWITEIANHDHLCPIGCVGELLIEGPILARGYVALDETTRARFITNPAWAKGHGDRRFYKTGDLVKYNFDGSIDYVGRKDTQFKLHGQRIESSEIEHHLSTDRHIRHAMILLPKSKSGQQRLTAIISLESVPPAAARDRPQLIQTESAQLEVSLIRKKLAEVVPGYMVPSIWLVVDHMSMTVSGKLNRLEMTKWVEQMDEDVYSTSSDAGELDGSHIPATIMEEKFQKILSQVLNLQTVRLDRSFLSLGGDSITAMQLRAKCRTEKIELSTQHILRSKSISQMALLAKSTSETTLAHPEILDSSFGLAPIQQMYFDIESKAEVSHHFHQSFLLRVSRRIGTLQMARAIEKLVGQHSLLRARFSQGENNQWTQRITGDVADSHHFGMHQLTRREQMMPLIEASQRAINIREGPVFSAALFNIGDNDAVEDSYQLLFLCAHHLVIDLVSWRNILRDLEELLDSGRLSSPKPPSFQTWAKTQAEYARKLIPRDVMPLQIPPADFGFWGMLNQANIFQDRLDTTFSLDEETTEKLFGVSNEALQTEPVDIILSALIDSFHRVFTGRPTPTIFSEGHGRESLAPELDAAEIVGWFTTMNPLHVPVMQDEDQLKILAHTKDLRRQVPSSGYPYFCSRFLSPEGKEKFGNHAQMEVILNYQGRYQQLERDDALLRPEPLVENEVHKDQGPDMEPFSLFEISVEIVQGKTRFSFAYNRHMHHQDLIRQWVSESKECLNTITNRLSVMEFQLTRSSFPLLSLDDSELSQFQSHLSSLGIGPRQIEAAYPTSPMQESMLSAQQKAPGIYGVRNIYDIIPGPQAGPVDYSRLMTAWQRVVDRHVSLRTIFVPSVPRKDSFDQVVLHEHLARIAIIECDDDDVSEKMRTQSMIDFLEPVPHHRLSIFKTASKVMCNLDISHALIDGMSMRLLMRDLYIAYESNGQLAPGPMYSDYIAFLRQQSASQDAIFWRQYLQAVQPCHLPRPEAPLSSEREQRSVHVHLNEDFAQIQSFCKTYGLTVANLIQSTWGLVLRKYTGCDDAVFGYLTSGRDMPVDGVMDLVGALIHMLLYRQVIDSTTTVLDLLQQTRNDFLQSLPHQYGLVPAIKEHTQRPARGLFNTIMSMQYSNGAGKDSESGDRKESLLRFENKGGQDPNQYDVSVAVHVDGVTVEISIAYWTDMMRDGQAGEMAVDFAKTLTAMMAQPTMKIVNLDI